MGLIVRGAAATVAGFILVVCLSPPALANPAVGIRILFDLGDGTYVWANETVSDPAVTNATWLAVLSAADANGVAIVSTWYASFGVAILDLGNRHPPAGFIGLYEWNATSHGWDLTSVGISSLVVSEGDTIALYNAGFDSHTFDVRQPVPTPDDPLPSMEFRGDLANSGSSNSRAPDSVRPIWDRDTGAREIAATPAVAYGKVFVTTMHGLFAPWTARARKRYDLDGTVGKGLLFPRGVRPFRPRRHLERHGHPSERLRRERAVGNAAPRAAALQRHHVFPEGRVRSGVHRHLQRVGRTRRGRFALGEQREHRLAPPDRVRALLFSGLR